MVLAAMHGVHHQADKLKPQWFRNPQRRQPAPGGLQVLDGENERLVGQQPFDRPMAPRDKPLDQIDGVDLAAVSSQLLFRAHHDLKGVLLYTGSLPRAFSVRSRGGADVDVALVPTRSDESGHPGRS